MTDPPSIVETVKDGALLTILSIIAKSAHGLLDRWLTDRREERTARTDQWRAEAAERDAQRRADAAERGAQRAAESAEREAERTARMQSAKEDREERRVFYAQAEAMRVAAEALRMEMAALRTEVTAEAVPTSDLPHGRIEVASARSSLPPAPPRKRG